VPSTCPIATDGFIRSSTCSLVSQFGKMMPVELAGGGIGEQHAGDWDRHRDIDRCELKAVERLRAPRQDPFT
jgi:hypothetical protein